jgi:serine/threonine-protein kinase
VTQLGAYTIVRKIAEGGMGEIFLAQRTGIRGFAKQVAVKRISPHLANEPTYVDMFLREARLAAMLDHPNVVQIHELLAEEDGCQKGYCLVMEYVPGLSLSRCMKAHKGPVPFAVAIQVAAQVAAGLQFVHDKLDDAGTPLKLVHRDVSPPNILLSTWGSVKITDFGIAKFRVASVLSQAGVIKGKYSYLSPEQVRGQSVDHRTDIYSLGLVLYEMTVGRRAYQGDDADVLAAVERAEHPPPEAIQPDYPDDLRAVVMRALAPDRDDRYQCCKDMQKDLLAVLASRGISGSNEHVARFVRNLVGESEGAIEEASAPVTPATVWATKDIHKANRTRRRLKIWALAASTLVLIASGVIALLASPDTSTPPSEERITPAGVPVEARPLPGGGVLSPTPTLGLEPAKTPTGPAKQQRRQRARRKARRHKSTPARVKGWRNVSLVSEPATVVYLGRRKLGRTPLQLRLPRRTVQLRLESREIGLIATRTLEAGEEKKRFRFGKGRLQFQLKPGVYIQLNGKMLGRSPLPTPVKVFEGRHRITVIDPFRYRRKSFWVVVKAGKKVLVSRQL